MKLIFEFIIFIFVSSYSTSLYRKACYFTSWSQYRNPPGKYLVNNVNLSLCTHVMYTFATIENNHLATTDVHDVDMYHQFSNLRLKNPTVKLLLSVGGWSFNLTLMTYMLSTYSTRQDFINSTIVFLRKYDFDGLDLDFEYPSRPPSPKSDRPKFTQFVKETRLAYTNELVTMGKEKLLLTIAIPAVSTVLDAGYDIAEISNNVDFLTVMTYDFVGSSETVTGHHAQLYAPFFSPKQLNINSSINYLKIKGVPLNKLNLGIPFYARGFVLKDPSNFYLGSPVIGPSPPGPITHVGGLLAFYEILKLVSLPTTRVYRQCDIQVPYLVNGNEWVGFDDVKSVENKANYIRKRRLGGYSIWALDFDDFNGLQGAKYPLLNKLHQIDDPNFDFVNTNEYNCAFPNSLNGNGIRFASFPDVTDDAGTYNCVDRNPCTLENISRGKYYFPAETAFNFIQCSARGHCSTVSCADGKVWDASRTTCIYSPQAASGKKYVIL